MSREPISEHVGSEPSTIRAPGTLARLAHELRTPLSAIAAAADIMHNERFGPIGDPRYREYSGDILESARHALGVINSMLAGLERTAHAPDDPMARPAPAAPTTPDASSLVFTQINANDLVERLASTVRALLDEASVAVELSLEPGLPHIIADAVSLRQILFNLLSNALRATPPGGRITLSTTYAAPGPLVIAVTDTGIGMDADFAAQTLANATAGTGTSGFEGGTGLGLAIVTRLAALNGARVSIDSKRGHGARVAIAFDPSRVVPV